MNIKKKHYNEKSMTEIPFILIGIVCYIVIAMLGTIISSYMLNREYIPISATNITAYIVQAVATISATVLSVMLSKQRKSIIAVCVTMGTVIIPIMTTILFFDSEFHNLALRILIAVIGTAPALSLSVYQKRSHFKRRRYKIY